MLKKRDGQINVLSILFFLLASFSVIAVTDTLNGTLSNTSLISLSLNESVLNLTINITSNQTLPEENLTVNVSDKNNTVILNDTINQTVTNETPVQQAENKTVVNEIVQDLEPASPVLASVVNGESINTPYAQEYLRVYNNFSDISYEKVRMATKSNAKLTVGAKQDNIRGFERGNRRYAVHLIACNHYTGECGFRVNGVPTGALKKQNTFNLTDQLELKINSMQFDYCDERRFCNLHYEAYDIVDISVNVKEEK